MAKRIVWSKNATIDRLEILFKIAKILDFDPKFLIKTEEDKIDIS